jgi:hypothetical protein
MATFAARVQDKHLNNGSDTDSDSEEDDSLSPIESLLDALPPHSNIAVITFVGSLCPPTVAHVEAVLEAKRLVLKESVGKKGEHVVPDAVVACISVNPDNYVARKVARSNNEQAQARDKQSLGSASPHGFFTARERQRMLRLSTAEHAKWIEVCPNAWARAEQIRFMFQTQHAITRYEIDGADVALKTRSWTRARKQDRYIAIGRPESSPGADDGTAALLAELEREKVDLSAGLFLVSRELPPVSSSRVRRALATDDHETLRELMHPAVLDWLVEKGHLQKP